MTEYLVSIHEAQGSTYNTIKKKVRDNEMVQQVRILPVLPEDPVSIPSNHTAAHSHL